MSVGIPFCCVLLISVNLLNFMNRRLGGKFLCLEGSIVIFIILMYYDKCSVDFCMKYFIVQSVGSVVFLFSYLNMGDPYLFLIFFSILIKLGLFPFHQ